jgi:ATP-binding cassette subfamily C exporter for protease/lipase
MKHANKKTAFFQRSELAGALAAIKREAWGVGLFSMVSNLLMLAPSLYMLQIYDRVLVSQSELTLVALSLITLFFFASIAFAEWARSRLLVRVGGRLAELLNHRIFAATFAARLQGSPAGTAGTFADFNNIRQFLTTSGAFAFFDAPWTPIYLAVVFLLHPLLGVIALLGIILLGILAWQNDRRTQLPGRQAQEAHAQASLYLHNKLRNAEVVESMGMAESLWRRLLNRHQKYLAVNSQAMDQATRIKSLTKFVRYSLQSLILGAGALLVIDSALTPGAMVAASLLMGRAVAPVEQLIGTWRAFVSARVAFLKLEGLLAEHPERPTDIIQGVPSGQLQLLNVVATVPGREQPVLQSITLGVAAGEMVAIVGPSGSGKSTLMRVVLGVWPNVEGHVQFDGEPVSAWSRDELGPCIGYLPQDVQLFDGSVAENIARFGEVESPKVIRAAQLAGVHDMVLRFPQGYNTPIGQGGSHLSGGMRQRIALARALYGDPRLIVLDEPNSNLDDAGEKALFDAIQALKAQRRTILLVTHRKQILGISDRILVMDEGRIHWFGKRDEISAMPRQSGVLRPVTA